MAWTYAIRGWRGESGVIKPAGKPLRATAREYLSRRIGGWPAARAWPAGVRELPEAAIREWQRLTDRRWPVELRLVGVIVFGFQAPGEPEPGALQCEAYARDGRRVPHRVRDGNAAWWTLGAPGGRVFRVAPAARAAPDGVAICEGPVTALAIAASRPRTLVLAVGGLASCVPHVRRHLPRGLPVRVYGDRDTRVAAQTGSRALAGLGETVAAPWLPDLDTPPGFGFADARREAAPRRLAERRAGSPPPTGKDLGAAGFERRPAAVRAETQGIGRRMRRMRRRREALWTVCAVAAAIGVTISVIGGRPPISRVVLQVVGVAALLPELGRWGPALVLVGIWGVVAGATLLLKTRKTS